MEGKSFRVKEVEEYWCRFSLIFSIVDIVLEYIATGDQEKELTVLLDVNGHIWEMV